MNTQVRESSSALRAAVSVAENICALPAVATQDWCDRAAAALLPIVGSGAAVTMLGQVDERGVVQRQEATGVAGVTVAEITTTLGRASSSSAVIGIDPGDAGLMRVRTNLAQAHELSWMPGSLAPGAVRVGTPAALAPTPAAQSVVARRWDAVPHGTVLLGAAALAPGGRTLVVELAASGPAQHGAEQELAVLEAVLPLLAKRAIMAIGADPTEHAAWLTQREQIILQHLLLGKSVREIADELGRSPHTVHDHVKSLHRKLHASSRGELVARALGYVELKPDQHGAASHGYGATAATAAGQSS